jgi:hypothetical protein
MDREFNLDITLCYHSVKLMPRIVKIWEGHACRMTVQSILEPTTNFKRVWAKGSKLPLLPFVKLAKDKTRPL